jgi:hypothetical protein
MSRGNAWWACQDLNLGPHPYQQNAGNRCAKRPFRRPRSTVGAEVMCSHRVQLCAVLAPFDSSLLSVPERLPARAVVWDLAFEVDADAWSGVDDERAADGVQPASHVGEPRAVRMVAGWQPTPVSWTSKRQPVAIGEGHDDRCRCTGVFACILQRLQTTQVDVDRIADRAEQAVQLRAADRGLKLWIRGQKPATATHAIGDPRRHRCRLQLPAGHGGVARSRCLAVAYVRGWLGADSSGKQLR